MMAPAWWVTYIIMTLYGINSAWLLWWGQPWASVYWLCALGITVCATQGFMK
jgi:hypothetical protein